jgi:hypothetical protein
VDKGQKDAIPTLWLHFKKIDDAIIYLLADLPANRAFQVSAGGVPFGTFTTSAQ